MFIENLRHVKNKRRILIGVLMGLIVISLLLTFANFGGSLNVSADASSDYLVKAEATAESAAASAKAAKGDMEAQGTAASAYLSLAVYQELFLEDNSKSYEKALKYGQAMVTACAKAEKADYATAYGYEFSAYQGLADADGLSAAFHESLDTVDLSESYLDSYYSAMSALGANDQFVTDMKTVTNLLSEEAEKEGTDSGEEATTDNDSEASEDSEGSEDTPTEEVSASDLIAYVANLVSQATASTADTADTTEK